MAGKIEQLERGLKQAAERLAIAKHKERVKIQRLEIQKKKSEMAALMRAGDAHRKIQLGGVVIAAGADGLDPAELCGLLLMALRHLSADKLPQLKEAGLQHFETRKNQR